MDTSPGPEATIGAPARYRTLLEITNAVISNLTRDALFHAVAQALRRVVPFERTAIFLHSPERDVLRLFVLQSSLPTTYFTVGLEMPPGESHVGWVLRSQRYLLRRDLTVERQYPMEDRAFEDGVRSYVIVPLVARSTAIGVLAVASVKQNQYSDTDAAFLQDVANQIAIAVENMKAYEEIAALKARLERENVYLREEIQREHNFVEMVGSSPALLAVLRDLDKVGELPLEAQVKLLRVLQEQEFEPVGSSTPIRVDVRIIAATNRDLEEAVRSGRFRADLFYRLNVFPIRAPALRERRSDIPQLVTFFVSRFAKKFGKRVEAVSKETMDRLLTYPWPGNIRELQNIIERAVVLSTGPILELGPDLLPAAAPRGEEGARARREPATSSSPAPASLGLDAVLEDVERTHVLSALTQAGWVIEGVRGAARILKLHPNTLRSRMERLGLRRPGDEVSESST